MFKALLLAVLLFIPAPLAAQPESGEPEGLTVPLPGEEPVGDEKSEDKGDEEKDEESSEQAEGPSAEGNGEEPPEGDLVIPEVEVIGHSDKDVEAVPGSAEVIDEEELESQTPMNTNEALRMVPGVHVQGEEGMGLRQNIGIRGLNPTRSRKIHVMEDGVPIALAPYGEPEMYYSPPVERIARIELVKGSGAILYGPQTIGGVINYITPQPPDEFTVSADARAGTYGLYQGELTVGDTTENGVGYWLQGIHQRFTGPRDLNLEMTDFTSKFRLNLNSTQTLSLKFNVYDEWSRSTYLGLTTPQYQNDPSDNFAENDRFKIRRYGAQATHVWAPSLNFLLETRLYGHNLTRHWRRQDFDRTPSCEQEDCYVRVIDGRGNNVVGDESAWPNDRSGVFFRGSTGNRNREFTVGGIEPRATVNWEAGGESGEAVKGELQTGTRFHVEHTEEKRINGNHPTSITGTIRDQDERLGLALAAYALHRFKFLDEKLEVSPGLRMESLWTSRTIFRTRVDGEPAGQPTDLDPPREEDKHILALIPGLGASYNVAGPLTLFGGMHRGFAPPRTKDAITKEGQSLRLEPEYSWNYEVGARVLKEDWLRAELTGFILDFQNQIIAPAEAGGAVSVDPEQQSPGSLTAVQGGETVHRGVEFGGTWDPLTMADSPMELPVSVAYTFVDAKFTDGWKTSISGNELPYSPDHNVSGRVAFRHPAGLELQVDGNWISGQYTDKVETVEPNPAGLIGWIDARFILDAKVSYTYEPWGLKAYVSAKNLLDEQYIASRAPRGIKPGMFRHVFGGLEWTL